MEFAMTPLAISVIVLWIVVLSLLAWYSHDETIGRAA